MVKIRDIIHTIGNFHNKISIAAGLSKVELQKKFKGNPHPAEIKKVLTKLSEIEQMAVDAAKDLRRLNEMVYSVVGPDAGKPK